MSHLPSSKHLLKQHFTSIAVTLGLGLTGLSASTISWADAEISVPESVIVLAIDGQETGNTGFFSKKHTTYTLPAGEHTLTARYDRLFELNTSDDHDIVRSNGVTIKVVLSDQQAYTLGWQPEPQTHEEAIAFAKQPTLIVTAAGGNIIASQKGAAAPKASFLSHLINDTTSLVAANRATTTDSNTINNSSTTNNQTVNNTAQPTQPIQSTTALQQLQSAWERASSEEKKQFSLWINQQVTYK